MNELNNGLYLTVEELSEEGNDLFEKEQFLDALKKYEQALNLLPIPKINWEASTWLYTSIADVYFSINDLEIAKNNYYNALNCPEGMGNAYIHFSLGQVLFLLGEIDKSRQSLLRSYMLEGEDIFKDEDPKFRKSIENYLKPPSKKSRFLLDD